MYWTHTNERIINKCGELALNIWIIFGTTRSIHCWTAPIKMMIIINSNSLKCACVRCALISVWLWILHGSLPIIISNSCTSNGYLSARAMASINSSLSKWISLHGSKTIMEITLLYLLIREIFFLSFFMSSLRCDDKICSAPNICVHTCPFQFYSHLNSTWFGIRQHYATWYFAIETAHHRKRVPNLIKFLYLCI